MQTWHRLARLAALALIAWAGVRLVYVAASGVSGGCLGDFRSGFPPPFLADPERFLPREFVGSWDRHLGRWNYGPGFHLLTAPLLLLPSGRSACATWLALNLGAILVSAVALGRLVLPDRQLGDLAGRRRWTLAAVAAWATLWGHFYPLHEALRQGNIEIVELLLIVLAWRWLARAKDARAGAAFGLAAMCKFLPALLLPWLLLRRRLSALGAAAAVIAVLGVAGELALGWSNSYTLRIGREGPATAAYQASSAHSQGLSKLVLRTLVPGPADPLRAELLELTGLDPERFGRRWRLVAGLLVALTAGILVMSRRPDRRLGDLAGRQLGDLPGLGNELGLLAALMVFVPPWSNDYYQVFLLVPFGVLFGEAATAHTWRRGLVLAGLALGTGSLPVPTSLIEQLLGWPAFGLHRLVQHLMLPAWTTALVLALFAARVWRGRGRRPEPPPTGT